MIRAKQSQVAFFILMAMMFVIIFIFSLSFQQEQQVDLSSSQASREIQSQLQTFISSCLSTSIDQGLVIAGIQGGFVTKNEGVYVDVQARNMYSPQLYESLGINTNSLQSLVYSHSYTEFPSLTFSESYPREQDFYGISILEDFEEYLRGKLLECLAIEDGIDGVEQVLISEEIPLEVQFQNDKVQVTVNLPLVISLEDGSSSAALADIVVERANRIAQLRSAAVQFLIHKLHHGKEETNQTVIDILSTLQLDGVVFQKKILYQQNDQVIFQYVLRDEQFRVFDEPFIFSFSYMNEAPRLDLSGFSSNEKSLFVNLATGKRYTQDLGRLLQDRQEVDQLLQYNTFREVRSSANGASFQLDSSGKMSFSSSSQGLFSYGVIISDGEVENNYEALFRVGVLGNEGNQHARSCFSIDYTNTKYPVREEFRRLFASEQGGTQQVYGYYIADQPIAVNFLCSDKDRVEYKVNGGASRRYEGPITIQGGIGKQTIEVEARVRTAGQTSTVRYVLTLYGVGCLGPDAKNEIITTCCNLDQIRQQIESGTPQAINNIRRNEIAYDFEAYMCLDTESLPTHDMNIWNLGSYNERLTSVFSGRLQGRCEGTSPFPEENLGSAGGNIPFQVKGLIHNEEIRALVKQAQIEVTIDSLLGTCRRCIMDPDFSFVVDVGGYEAILDVALGEDYELGGAQGAVCDERIYVRENRGGWEGQKTLGRGVRSTIDLGMGICSSDTSCVTQTRQTAFDSMGTCRDSFYTGREFETVYAPASWTCGTDKQCSGVSFSCS